MSQALDPSQQVNLPLLLDHWFKNDDLMKKHFISVIFTSANGYFSPPDSLGAIHLDCKWPKSPKQNHSYGPKIAITFDTTINILHGSETIYKFQAIHPMFFQKLRGYLYDAHNRCHLRCHEYLR